MRLAGCDFVMYNCTYKKSFNFVYVEVHIANALPTGLNLQTRRVLVNTNCLRCGEPESISHILFDCNFAKEVWKLDPWQNTVDTNETSTVIKMIQEAIR